jgi:hypothetical protein
MYQFLESEAAMSRRIDWERARDKRRGQRGLSLKDETEFRSRDVAARWLERAEDRERRKAKRIERLKAREERRSPRSDIRVSGDGQSALPGAATARRWRTSMQALTRISLPTSAALGSPRRLQSSRASSVVAHVCRADPNQLPDPPGHAAAARTVLAHCLQRRCVVMVKTLPRAVLVP